MISIVIPTFNRIGALKRCLESIFVQVYDGLEVIVIDDFSADATGEYLVDLAGRHPFIKAVFNSENKGVNYTRNRGIEVATKKFIMFLDSDDELTEGSLAVISNSLHQNAATKHFLFVVSDRAAEFKNITLPVRVKYEDWLSDKIMGDFTHVVLTEIMKRYLFFEQFRLYEYLNWLRLQKETSPQLLVPAVTTRRDRNRSDSLTLSSILSNAYAIRSKFESEKLYYSLYYKDLCVYSQKSLNARLIQAVMLGVAAYRKNESRLLIRYADKSSVKIIAHIIMMLPSLIVRLGIIQFSNYKRRSFIKR